MLVETANKVWRQLFGMLAFLLFIITVFVIIYSRFFGTEDLA